MQQFFITTTNAMSKVLKITKTDKTVHVVPLANKAFFEAYNNRQPADKKWRIEEIDEKEAKNLPYIDESFVTGAEAVVKVQDLEKSNAEKDAEIERLKALLAGKGENTRSTGTQNPPRQNAADVIALIEAATSVEQVEALVKGDDRKTVGDAAAKKIASLKG